MNSPQRDASQDLARDLRRAADPISFARDCGLTSLDDWQGGLLCSSSHRILALCSRQSGKTTVSAVRVLHRIINDPGLALIIAPSLRQSTEFFRTLMGLYHRLDGAPKPTSDTTTRLELDTGARVVTVPGSADTVRGFAAPKVVVLEEAAFIPREVIMSVLPMISTVPDADLLAISSAGAEGTWFHDMCRSAEGWHRFTVTADTCPRVRPFLEEARTLGMGPLEIDREYFCKFTADNSALFDDAIISRVFTKEVQPLWPSFR